MTAKSRAVGNVIVAARRELRMLTGHDVVDIELLTIKLRLLIDKAREMGVNWWESDPWLSSRASTQIEGANSGDTASALEDRLERIEKALSGLAAGQAGPVER